MSSSQSQEQGHGQPPSSGSLEEEERELELLLEEELELEELDELDEDQEELLDEEELELLKELEDEELELLEDDELEEELLELLEEELEDGALLEEVGVSGTKELLWKLEDDQLLEEDEEELELLDRDELEEESGSSGAQELCWELEDELLEEEELELLEEELELLLDLGSNSNESPPPAELLDESPLQGAGRRTVGGGRARTAGRRTRAAAGLGIKLKRISSPCRTARRISFFHLLVQVDQSQDGFSFLAGRRVFRQQVIVQVGLAFLVAYQGNAELLLGVRGWLVLVNNVAPVVSLVELDLAAQRGGRARLRGEFQILGGNGKGDGGVGVEVEKTGGGSHDLEVSEPFVPGRGGSGAFGDKDRSGEAVDQEVALGLSVGVGVEELGSVESSRSLAGMEREMEEWAWRWRKQVAGAMTLRYPNHSCRVGEEAVRLGIRTGAERPLTRKLPWGCPLGYMGMKG
ncbi:conserved Plasmodium protein [Akkermansia sp. CAG:344]|nr:conserved Plasmodium protein [Akkermansia sp. CAG:344]